MTGHRKHHSQDRPLRIVAVAVTFTLCLGALFVACSATPAATALQGAPGCQR